MVFLCLWLLKGEIENDGVLLFSTYELGRLVRIHALRFSCFAVFAGSVFGLVIGRMFSPNSHCRVVSALLLACTYMHTHAGWREDIGYVQLSGLLGAGTPVGSGQRLSQVEAGGGPEFLWYAPVTGTDTITGTGVFAGVPFYFKSGADGTGSSHALDVGYSIYGRLGFGGRSGPATGVSRVDCYEVNDWLGATFLNIDVAPPLLEASDVANHSWAAPSEGSDASYNRILRGVDFSVVRDDYLAVVGLENDATLPPSLLLASAYNVISVGTTAGQHAHGPTLTSVDGGGRAKPEIVAPADFTSFATALVSGSALVLREMAAPQGANALHHLTIKAALLAGATKEEFPNWERTSQRPLDATFGAGELNIWNSRAILLGLEQAPGTAPVALHGWDLGTANSARDYVLTLPPALAGSQLSAVLVWDRTLTDAPGPLFLLSPSTLPNFSLALSRLQGTVYVATDSSDSTVDNLEHIWKPSLASGTYRLRVSAASGQYALAWRVTPPAQKASVTIARGAAAGTLAITGRNVVPGQTYTLQSSGNLLQWTNLSTFTASAATHGLTVAQPTGAAKYFYRLAW